MEINVAKRTSHFDGSSCWRENAGRSPMMDMDHSKTPPGIPPFEIAVARFQAFVAQVGHCPRKLVWLFREDVSTHTRRVLVKVPIPTENEQIARSRYEQGRRLGVGVCLDAFCWLESDLCCSVWFVGGFPEAARQLCYGLKLSVPTELSSGEPIRNEFWWNVRKQFDINSGLDHFKNFLPLREIDAE
jgi:hypothetical protein